MSTPEAPKGAAVDKAAVRAKYAEERQKRLRADGNAQYVRMTHELARYLDDPHMPVRERAPVTDHVTFAFIGGGWGGLVTCARLVEAGITDVRIVEKGGDFGGAWYWNRYPGVQCDTASFVYMPLLEETGHMPSEKYAHGPEILEHARRIGRHYKLYERALFHTEVASLEWQAQTSRWLMRTKRGDAFTAQFVGMGLAGLHVPKLPGIAGIDTFRGRSFHTSRWDYDYTGGDALGAPMTKLADKRVAVIGTGATAVQCIPHLARSCKQLYVFQRTPSSVDARNNAPTDAKWFETIATPGWQQRWLENFTDNQTGGGATEDLVKDGWTEIAKRVREKIIALPAQDRTPVKMLEAFEDSDLEKMSEIRARVDSIVKDHDTAQSLKAWYRQLCKRPCFHDEYLDAYNAPGVTLVDTDGKGVERVTERGVVVAGKEYEVDCIVYASGFELGAGHTERMGFDLTGRDGLKLSEYWSESFRTMHGIHVRGFPNAFLVQPAQGANLISNIPHNLVEAGRTVATILKHMQAGGFTEVEVSQAAQDAWISLLLSGPGRMLGSQDCTPGYYNNEGQDPGPNGRLFVGYPYGASAYFRYLNKWRESGVFEGLEFSGRS